MSTGSGSSFYITTPIYYVNDVPHIGHAYTTILADVLARYRRLLGVPTYFLTGTDEHGQKVHEAAVAKDVTPQAHVDRVVQRFVEVWKRLEIQNDDFIRTTDKRHTDVVQETLQDLFDRDEIYRGEYEGWYDVREERFYTERDLVDGKSPDGNPVEKIVETNYFFRMSKYQDWLVDYIEKNPSFIQPAHRRNETLGFLRKPLGDLCISRPKTRLPWGIELPFDRDYVCYVWFDALLNYVTAVGYRRNEEQFAKWWPASYHLIGKDILTTHTVYWPTMLKAMNVPMPECIFAHGWWLVGESKMGKSAGNAQDPMDMIERYGVDSLRYFLMAEMTLGQDATFTEEVFVTRYNADLANDLGNLASRVLKMIDKNFGGKIPEPGEEASEDAALRELTIAAVADVEKLLEGMALDRAVARAIEVVREANRYFDRTAPWKLAKAGDTARLAGVMYTAAECLRVVSGLLYPVVPEKMSELRRALSLTGDEIAPRLEKLRRWGGLVPGRPLGDLAPLFPRIDVKALAAASSGEASREASAGGEVEGVALIDIDTFFRTQLRVARVEVAERVPKADRLLRLEIHLGDERRQVVAGIAQHYEPEDLLGRQVVVVTNLAPAKIRGVESRGMILAAKAGKSLRIITVDGDVPPGTSVG